MRLSMEFSPLGVQFFLSLLFSFSFIFLSSILWISLGLDKELVLQFGWKSRKHKIKVTAINKIKLLTFSQQNREIPQRGYFSQALFSGGSTRSPENKKPNSQNSINTCSWSPSSQQPAQEWSECCDLLSPGIFRHLPGDILFQIHSV